jgi:phosphomannomutase
MKISGEIFRAYDVRGVYKKGIDEHVMQRLGNAFSLLFADTAAVVGMDGRTSSPQLLEALVRGIRDAGKDVISVGLAPRSACLYHAWKRRLPSAYVTASHLPKEWNGCKLSYASGIEFLEKDNREIRDYVLALEYEKSAKPGRLVLQRAAGEYVRYMLKRTGKAKKKLRVVIDCGNGTGGLAAPEMFRKAGFRVETLFSDVDGRFPNRDSEIEEKNLASLKKAVRDADIGIAYDGDSDRMALCSRPNRYPRSFSRASRRRAAASSRTSSARG